MEVALKESLEKLIPQWLGLPIFTGTTFLSGLVFQYLQEPLFSVDTWFPANIQHIYIYVYIYIYISYIMEISIER